MNVAFVCRNCDKPVQAVVAPSDSELKCTACGQSSPIHPEDFADGKLQACLVCGCRELFVRKDFSQRLGVTIVVCGLLGSSIAWGFHMRYVSYAILFATAFADLVLYLMVKNILQCYRCQAAYRGLNGLEAFEPFDLETHEKFRQQAIRLAQSRK